MAPIDWFIAAVLVLSVFDAARKGFFIETFSLVGVVAGLLIASWTFERPLPYILRFVQPPPIAEAISFLAIALGITVAAGLLGRLLHRSAAAIGLGWLDRLAGAAFGFVKGCVVVTLGVIALAAFFPRSGWLNRSQFAPYFLSAAHTTTAITPFELGQRIRNGVRIIKDAQPEWLKPHAALRPAGLACG